MVIRCLVLALLLIAQTSIMGVHANENIAVIIGNSDYGPQIPKVSYASRDADAIRAFLINLRGFNPDNIIDLRNATKAQMEATFGSATNPKGRLWRYSDAKETEEVFVYYSGHGVPGLNDRKRYLLPVDADPDFAELNGYPLELLYRNLGHYRMATIVLDACFSGTSAGGTLFPSTSGLIVVPKGEPIIPMMTTLSATGSNQLANWDHTAQHGLFTEYFLRAVYGEADKDKDGIILATEIEQYLKKRMTKMARRNFGRVQEASLAGNKQRVFVKYSPLHPPKRPHLALKRKKQVKHKAPVKEETSHKPVLKNNIIKLSQRDAVAKWRTALHKAPDENSDELEELSKNQHAIISGRTQDNKWRRVTIEGGVGFVKKSALAKLNKGEFNLWQTAQYTGNVSDYRTYLRHHPGGYFSDLAVEKIYLSSIYFQDGTPLKPPSKPVLSRPLPPVITFIPGTN